MSFGRSRFGGDGAQIRDPIQPASIDINFLTNVTIAGGTGTSTALITCTRASSGTDLLPTSASSAPFNVFASGAPRITPNSGILIEQSRTNSIANSTAPATQTCTLAVGTFVLWVNGSGTCASSAGTAIGSGFATASQGTFVTLTITTSGTVVFTVSGSLAAMQCEKMPGTIATPSSLIATGASAAGRAADVVTITTPPTFGSAYTIYASGTALAPSVATNAQSLLQSDTGSDAQRLAIRRNTSGAMTVTQAGGSGALAAGFGTLSPGVAVKAAAAIGTPPNEIIGASEGKLQAATAASLPTTPTAVHIGCNAASGEQWSGYISRVRIWPTVILSPGQITSIVNSGGA